MLLTDKSIISQIKYQVPWFYRQEYPLFIKFLEYYYQWMETLDKDNSFGVLALLDNYKRLKDIDSTLENLLVLFKSTYFKNFPEETVVQKRIFIKRVIDLYRARGTKDSLNLLLYIILGEKPDLYYPREFLAKSSSVSFENIFFAYCLPTSNLDFFILKNNLIKIGNEEILVSNVYKIGDYYQLILDIDSSIRNLIKNETTVVYKNVSIGTLQSLLFDIRIVSSQNIIFRKDQTFSILNDDSKFPAILSVEKLRKGKIDSYTINNGGTGFRTGDKFVTYQSGLEFEAVVSQVNSFGTITQFFITKNNFVVDTLPTIISLSQTGKDEDIFWYSSAHQFVEKVKIIDSGIGIDSSKVISYVGISGYHTFDITTSTIGLLSKFSDQINLLGQYKVLQDNFFFQNFSYVVSYTSDQVNFPETEVKSLIHPAGYLLFVRKDIDDSLLQIEDPDLDFYLEQKDHIITVIINCEDLTYNKTVGLKKYTDDSEVNHVNNYNYNSVDMKYCFELGFNLNQQSYDVSSLTIDSSLLSLENIINNLSSLTGNFTKAILFTVNVCNRITSRLPISGFVFFETNISMNQFTSDGSQLSIKLLTSDYSSITISGTCEFSLAQTLLEETYQQSMPSIPIDFNSFEWSISGAL